MRLTPIERHCLVAADNTDFRQCHASTLITLADGSLLVAWFAGQKEGSGDTGIWMTRRQQGIWQALWRAVSEEGLAHWNPVLHNTPDGIWLFYKVGSGVHHWVTRYVKSTDNGHSWSQPAELVAGETLPRGPVKNKVIVTADGTWLAPGSTEDERHWDAQVDRSEDSGKSWHLSPVPLAHLPRSQGKNGPLWQGLLQEALWENDLERVLRWDGVIQPTLWESSPNHIHMLMRSTRGWLYRSDSTDNGKTWCEARPTSLPNNNSGIDLVRTASGVLVLAWNPVGGNWGQRYPISLSVSTDNGESWAEPVDLENEQGEFSYPAIISDGDVIHLTYTWNRKNIVYHRFQITC